MIYECCSYKNRDLFLHKIKVLLNVDNVPLQSVLWIAFFYQSTLLFLPVEVAKKKQNQTAGTSRLIHQRIGEAVVLDI